MIKKINQLDWDAITDTMHTHGYAVINNLLSTPQCQDLINLYDQENAFRKTVVMARHRFGLGTYKYFNYPLPPVVQTMREQIYTKLTPIANAWMEVLKTSVQYPETHAQFLARCHASGQRKPTALILKYDEGGFNTLHQDLYGEVFFPIQLVLFLNDPLQEYAGGEFVLTEQIPRAQSKAIVLRPGKGDGLLFTTSFRPVNGVRGYYRANMRHGVSPVLRGKRHTLGIIFHDAES